MYKEFETIVSVVSIVTSGLICQNQSVNSQLTNQILYIIGPRQLVANWTSLSYIFAHSTVTNQHTEIWCTKEQNCMKKSANVLHKEE